MAVKRPTKNCVRSTRSATLALIAMLELLLLCVSLTFSWFEQAADPYLKGEDISTAGSLMSTFVLDGTNNTVELIEHTDEGVYKGRYFELGSRAKFSPVHSDNGIDFISANELPLNTNEVHAATLTFQIKVNSVGTDCNFWFDSLELKIDNVTSFVAGQRGIQLDTVQSNNDSSMGGVVTGDSSEVSTEASSDGAAAAETSPQHETERQTDDTTESATEVITEEEVTETSAETTGDGEIVTEAVEAKPETKEPDTIVSAFYVCFSDGESSKLMSLADAESYMSDAENSLFSCKGDQETVITCTIWLDYKSTACADVPAGASVSINMVLASDWSAMKTVEFTDDTLYLDGLISQLGTDGIVVEAYHSATDTVYPATYDSENDVWRVELPQAIDEYEMRYYLNSEGHDLVASWNIYNAEDVRRVSLMDEGMYLVVDS